LFFFVFYLCSFRALFETGAFAGMPNEK